MLYVRLSVRPSTLFKSSKTKNTMFATGVTVGLAEWIIDDTCLACLILALLCYCWKSGLFLKAKKLSISYWNLQEQYLKWSMATVRLGRQIPRSINDLTDPKFCSHEIVYLPKFKTLSDSNKNITTLFNTNVTCCKMLVYVMKDLATNQITCSK